MRVRVDIWRDEDWRHLTHDAQWLYLSLLSQPKLNLAGCLDLKPSVWATLARDTHRDDLQKWLTELEQAHLVVVDWATEELVIRTFTAHDGVFYNRNLGRGVWSAWAAIESPDLRTVVIENMPDEAWDVRFEAPMEARVLRHRGADE